MIWFVGLSAFIIGVLVGIFVVMWTLSSVGAKMVGENK